MLVDFSSWIGIVITMDSTKPRKRRSHQQKVDDATAAFERAAARAARKLIQLEKFETAGRASERKRDTRRKIVAGALALQEKDPAFRRRLWTTLDNELTVPRDRELFGLPPLPDEQATDATPQAA